MPISILRRLAPFALAWCRLAGISAAADREARDPDAVTDRDRGFWAFRPLSRPEPPLPPGGEPAAEPVDRFLLGALRARGLGFSEEADRRMLCRRVHLDLTGLPPAPEETEAFAGDPSPDAYEKLIARLLESPRHGERWGRHWLDAAGYADSNGYHREDTPRPLAFAYRDYVIRSINRDKPYDRFIQEQLAGDELVDYRGSDHLPEDALDALIATHFLRNGPDGTDSTEGNEKVRTLERYAVIEQEMQIVASALFGLTIDCARCHSHKFDPIPQRDYYALQAIFYPAFNVKSWTQPKDRWIHAAGRSTIARWMASKDHLAAETVRLRGELETWLAAQRVIGEESFREDFSGPGWRDRWSPTAPGDAPAEGKPLVRLDGAGAPAARVESDRLEIAAAASGDSVWLSTRRSFDWTPGRIGGWIQATFDLASDSTGGSAPASRFGYYVALRDHDDAGSVPGGNILIDGNPAGGAAVHLDYPGSDSRGLGTIGTAAYRPGRRYGVRIIRTGEDEYLLAHLVDGMLEKNTLLLGGAQLPDGGFGFELCCGRSFAVDNVAIAASDGAEPADAGGEAARFGDELRARRREMERALRELRERGEPEPQRIAWVTDLSPQPPEVRLLKRGDHFQPGEAVEPGFLSVLDEPGAKAAIEPPFAGAATTGRRLALARWATRPGSRAAALLARVQANRIWQGHFGRGLVETSENFGARGSPPSHPGLLEWLAAELAEGGWSQRRLHRRILLSRAYRQSSAGAENGGAEVDPDNRLLWRYPSRRLEAEAIRDSMLAAAGALDLAEGGPAVDFEARPDGQVVLGGADAAGPLAKGRRSVYIRFRRSQPLTFLQVFDQAAPSPNCLRRPASAVVSQALAMLNGEFAVGVSRRFAARLESDGGEGGGAPGGWIRRAFLLALARLPEPAEIRSVADFLGAQARLYREAGPASDADAARRALEDFCRMLLASNEFAYIQ